MGCLLFFCSFHFFKGGSLKNHFFQPWSLTNNWKQYVLKSSHAIYMNKAVLEVHWSYYLIGDQVTGHRFPWPTCAIPSSLWQRPACRQNQTTRCIKICINYQYTAEESASMPGTPRISDAAVSIFVHNVRTLGIYIGKSNGGISKTYRHVSGGPALWGLPQTPFFSLPPSRSTCKTIK